MGLVEHARRELELCGQTAEDPGYAASLVAAVAAFASYGHSGGSAMCAIEQLHQLLQYRTLSPLTSDPAEWIDQSLISGYPMWQNARDPAAMSRDAGQTWYFVDDRREPDEDTDPELVDLLADAGNRWGALGVALAAAELTDPEVLIGHLRREPRDPIEAPEPEST